ncbi:hypothetical protein FRC10_002284 [Ceratobasidium sp. 414]|nr:hypothetical protein FRC10_002284 [Ceratobasidium sp. 414]
MASTPAKVFQMPELVYLISACIDREQLVGLMTVSKSFFSSTVPRIWEIVPGAAPLFQFLPCVISDEAINIDGLWYHGSFAFENTLSEADFRRFNLYAPYVKHLDLFRREEDLKLTSGWEILVDYVNAGHTLLPNLVTLLLEPPPESCFHILPYPWVLVFCSPTLDSISISIHLGELSPRVVSGLCHLLARTCPNLTALEFEPLPEEMDSDQDKYLSPQSKEIDCTPDLLRPNSPLQRLSIGMYFMDKYLPFISQMSKLQSLELTYSDWDMATTRTKLPLNSFPVLTELTFNEVELLEVGSAWEHVPELFANLTKLECIFAPAIPHSEYFEPILRLPLRFVTALEDRSLNITDLAIRFDHEDYVESQRIHLHENTLRILAKLPLRRLSVGSITLIEPGYTDTEICGLLASTFPNLEVLRWSDQRATRQGLHAFADMPNLRHLGFFTIEHETADWAMGYPESAPPSKAPLQILETHLWYGGWLPIVGYIARLWPDVQIVPLQVPRVNLLEEAKARIEDRYKFINGFIALNRDDA